MKLPDYLAPGLRVVFCGTAAGETSARLGHYYARPGNGFWSALHLAGFTSRRLLPREDASLLDLGIGLTDLAKHVSGNDAVLKPTDFDLVRFRAEMLRHQPRFVAFDSKRAAREFFRRNVDYGLQAERIGQTAIFVLPSTSGAARSYWTIEPWKELASLAGFRPPATTLSPEQLSQGGDSPGD